MAETGIADLPGHIVAQWIGGQITDETVVESSAEFFVAKVKCEISRAGKVCVHGEQSLQRRFSQLVLVTRCWSRLR